MKKLNLLILGLAIVSIFSCQKTEEKKAATLANSPQASSSRIVYVNTDTLLNNYQYYKDVVKEFENKRSALEGELAKKSQAFQVEVAGFQKKAQAGGISQEQGQGIQAQLQKKEQDIMSYRDKSAAKLQEDQAKKTDRLLTNIQDYLKSYNKDNKFDMVIGYSKGGGVLYAKEDLDITAEVLKGLNEEYKSKGQAVDKK